MPFGEELYADGTNRTTGNKFSTASEDAVRKRFTGYEKDKETGLDFAEARYYNNQHGRFTAVDPLLASGQSANPQTFNRFVYVMNNPLAFTDPSGLQAATNVTPCPPERPCSDYQWTSEQLSAGQIHANGEVTVDVVGEADLVQMSAPALLGISITARMPSLAGSAAGAGSLSGAAGPVGGACAALLCSYLLADRIANYTPGGIYDNTANPTTWVDGLPHVSMIGSTNTGTNDPALSIPIPTTRTDTMPPPLDGPGMFRGGPSLMPGPNDNKIRDGLVQTTHGVSVNIDPLKVMPYGGAFRVGPLPPGLTYIQRGKRDPGHYEIVPTTPMPMNDYTRLLGGVSLTPYRP